MNLYLSLSVIIQSFQRIGKPKVINHPNGMIFNDGGSGAEAMAPANSCHLHMAFLGIHVVKKNKNSI